MKTRVIAILLLFAMLLPVMAGCGSKTKVVSQEQAQKIAMEEIDIAEDQVTDVHIHVVTESGIPCYSVHLTTDEGDFSVVIHAGTGEVLDVASGSGH